MPGTVPENKHVPDERLHVPGYQPTTKNTSLPPLLLFEWTVCWVELTSLTNFNTYNTSQGEQALE